MNQELVPVRKVTAAGLGGSIATIVVWMIELTGVGVPGAVGAAFSSVCAFGSGYLIKE